MQTLKTFSSSSWLNPLVLPAKSQTLNVSSKLPKPNLCNNIYTDEDINKNEAFESLIRAENKPTEIDSLKTPQTQACRGRVSEMSWEAVTAGTDGLVRAAEPWRD